MGKRRYRITKVAKSLIIQLVICSIVIVSGFTWKISDENNKWDNLYYPGVKIASLDLGGKTKEQGENMLKSRYSGNFNDYKLDIKVGDKNFELNYSKLIKDSNMDEVVDKAFNTGKNLGFLNKHHLIKQGVAGNYNICFIYDEDYLKKFIGDMEKEVNREPVNASIELSSDGLINIIDEVKGIRLKNKELEEYIKNIINEKYFERINIQAPVEEISAFVTADMLAPIDTEIASYSTGFASSPMERARNVELAAKAINGRLLMPGDIFSFNDIVGERTKEKGYMTAPVIEDGDFKSGLGGGICQVSSTLYNVVLKSGINPIERKSHSLPASYVELGLDATVSWGSIDFKFENTLDYPIFIESYTENKMLHINFYSNANLTKREYVIRNEIYDKIPPKIQIIEDESLPKGGSKVVRKGSDGYWVKVIRNTYEDGELIDSEIISDDYYKPVDRIIKKGTGNDV